MHVQKKFIRLFYFFILILFLYTPFSSITSIFTDIPNNVETNLQYFSDKSYETAVTTTTSPDETEMTFYANQVPLKQIQAANETRKKVVPGGESIGIQLQSTGVVVVGHHELDGKNVTSPAKQANIRVGDIILSMNDEIIKDINEIPSIVEKSAEKNKNIAVTLKRNGKEISTNVKPVKNKKENKYQIGLYMKNASSGIGTITFYDPTTKKYGALGHTVNDAATNKPVNIHDGKIVLSNVTSIKKGNKGIPGEKKATFSMKQDKLGNVVKNSPFGIYGTLNDTLLKNEEPLDIAFAHEIEKGPAEIWTVIEKNKIEKFDVEILHASKQPFKATKGIVLKVTDKRLLDKTGGIVQGMSGSPIIQNGKIIGAVTHVFVNDPTSGYGVHIEWMLEEAELTMKEENDAA